MSQPAKKTQQRSVKLKVSTNTKHEMSLMEVTSAPIRAQQNGLNVVKNYPSKFMFFWLLWFQTITGRSSIRNRMSKNVMNLGNPEPQIRETDGDQTIF